MAILSRGSKGEAVELLQRNLMTLGFDVGSHGADGSFGGATDAAVRKFQRAHGLDDDGVVGKDTRAAMAKAMAEKIGVKDPAWQKPDAARVDRAVYQRPLDGDTIYHTPTRAGFTAPEQVDVAALPDDVRAQANAQGWVMMFMPGERSALAKGTGVGGTFLVANVNSGQTFAYPAVTGGLTAQGNDQLQNGPIPGSKTDFWGDNTDGVNAVYGNARYVQNYTSSYGVNYAGVIKIEDSIPGRSGFLIHKTNTRGGTIGCIGLESDVAVAEVGGLVQRYGIRNMVVLDGDQSFVAPPKPTVQYASQDAGPNGVPPQGKPMDWGSAITNALGIRLK